MERVFQYETFIHWHISTEVKDEISKEIEEGNMEYYDGDLSQKEQVKKFRKDWKTETRATINSRLTYGDYDYTYNNEEM